MVVGLKGGSDAAMMSALAKEASSASSNKVDTPATKSATSHKRKPRFHLRPQGFMADHSNTAWWFGTFFYFHKKLGMSSMSSSQHIPTDSYIFRRVKRLKHVETVFQPPSSDQQPPRNGIGNVCPSHVLVMS